MYNGLSGVVYDFATRCGADGQAFVAEYLKAFPKPYAGMADDAKAWAISRLRAA